ncbi:MAG: class I SAM-dependent methyltransferase [Nitrospirae bacterium]|nr:class I SAM-dependent methyltransferase [Nitrospirota bacterium]
MTPQLRKRVRSAARILLMRWLGPYFRLRAARRRLWALAPHKASYADALKATRACQDFWSAQKEVEIVALLELVEKNAPRYVCEIGTRFGGTFFLLSRACRPDATLITIDCEMLFERRLIYRSLGVPGQRLVPIHGASSAPAILERVRRELGSHLLDLLFIDGDHSYEGVSRDFRLYSPLVRRGGLIVLHDIVLDHRQRYGKETDNNSGQVPTFWNEVKQKYAAREFVGNPDQNAYGIGVLQV